MIQFLLVPLHFVNFESQHFGRKVISFQFIYLVEASQSKLARSGHITTAWMTQIMTLLHLAPDIQEQILFLPRVERGRGAIQELDVRPIAATLDWRKQRRMWAALVRKCANDDPSS